MLKRLATAAFLVLCAPALAETQVFGPFRVAPEHPTVAVMLGEILQGDERHFVDLMAAYPDLQTIGLSSPGGDVTAGLAIAEALSARGLDTLIPKGEACYSACAYVFFAGRSRQVDGEIGVHMPEPVVDGPGVRVAIELEIRRVLAGFDVPIWIYDGVLNTPHDQLRVFSAAEAAEIGLNR